MAEVYTISAKNLCEVVEEDNASRTEELKKAALMVLDVSIHSHILNHRKEIVENRSQDKGYELSLEQVKDLCDAAGKTICAPISTEEFNVVIENIATELTILGYQVTSKKRAGNLVEIFISV